MDIKLPFRRHLDWLILEGNSAEEVRAFYDNIQLPHPTDAHIAAAEKRVSQLMLPPGMRARIKKGRFNTADQALLDRLGFGEMYDKRLGQGKVDWSCVGKLLSHPVMRVALDCSLMVRLSEEEICSMLPNTFGVGIKPDDVELYTRYFFDFKSMDLSDWRSYLEILRGDHYSYIRLHAALTKTQDEVLYLVGLPTKMQFSSFLKNVLATADYKFRYYTRQNTPEGDSEARKWGKIGVEVGEKLDKFSATDASDFAKLIQTDFEYIQGDIPTIQPEMVADIKPQLVAGQGETAKVKAPALLDPNTPAVPQNQNDQNRL